MAAAAEPFSTPTIGRKRPADANTVGTVNTAVAGISVEEYGGEGMVRRTVITCSDVAQAVVNGTEYQNTLLYTFPAGRILVLGVVVNGFAQTTTSAIASTLNSGVTGAFALGSAVASNVSLTSTMANHLATTAFTTSTTINVAATAVNAGTGIVTAAGVDGTTTPVPVYLNTAYATTGDVDADATQTIDAVIEITWMVLGDY